MKADMSRRSRAREAVLQILYQDDLNTGRRLDPDEAAALVVSQRHRERLLVRLNRAETT